MIEMARDDNKEQEHLQLLARKSYIHPYIFLFIPAELVIVSWII